MKVLTQEEKRIMIRELFGNTDPSPDGFATFFALYDRSAKRENDLALMIPPESKAETLTHNHVVQAAHLLRGNPGLTKEEMLGALRRLLPTGTLAADVEVERLLDLAVRCITMLECAAQRFHAADYSIGGYRPTSWRPSQPYVDFFNTVFPPDALSQNERTSTIITKDMMSSLTAWKLVKRLGIKFKPTDDIDKHLLLDQRRNFLFLFHHARFLKAQLSIHFPIEENLATGFEESLEKGTLPPQLLMETIYSLQVILFPPHNRKSAGILKKLITNSKSQFDPECQKYGGEPTPTDFRYIYWAKRIADLDALLRKRPPKNSIERWLQWQSSNENALLIAFVALLISIVVGVISIGLSAVQIWISWMAWKHPIGS